MPVKPHPKQPEGLIPGAGGIPPKFGTFTPPADYLVGQDAEIERLLQSEREAVAKLIGDAVEILGRHTPRAARVALRQRAEKLSLSGRITARTLTKLALDMKYPPNARSSPKC